MPTPTARYRKLTRYKYQLVEDYRVSVPIKPTEEIVSPYVALSREGELFIKAHYAWDGPSGPTIDIRSFMRGSLIHDALYQLMRLNLLDTKSQRIVADRILQECCKADGMWALVAWLVYLGVHWFGASNAKHGTEKPDEIMVVP